MDHTERMRAALRGKRVTEKAMFGGVCFMLRDHMLCAASPRGYLFRVGKEQHGAALQRAGARPMEMNGRRYEGYVRVDPGQCGSAQAGCPEGCSAAAGPAFRFSVEAARPRGPLASSWFPT